MASAKFLEEALSTDVDESAVNAIVGSLETQLTSSAPSSTVQDTQTLGQNHIISAISNGGTKHEGNLTNGGDTVNVSVSAANVQCGDTSASNGANVQTGDGQVKILQYTQGSAVTVPANAASTRLAFPAHNGNITNVQQKPQSIVIKTTAPNLVMPINTVNTNVTQLNSTASVAGVQPGVMTLAKPMAQTVAASTQNVVVTPQNAVIPGNVQIVNVRPPAQQQKAAVQSRVVLSTAPQMVGARPGQPQQITLQSFQGLQPGQQGHLLLKTENGQYQLLRVGPAPTAATAPPQGAAPAAPTSVATTYRLQTLPAVSRIGTQFVGQPLTLRKTIVQQANSVTSTPVSSPAAVQTQQGVVMTSVASNVAVPNATTQPAQQRTVNLDNTKEKCRKFLANLLELSSREPKSVERNVRTLIQELIDCKVEPEEFCDRLERLLNASPQPCLIGFLKKSLPLLRQSLVTKELSIDGIRPPPANVVFSGQNSVSNVQTSQIRTTTPVAPTGTTQVRIVSPVVRPGQPVQQRLLTPLRGATTGQPPRVIARTQGPTVVSQPPALHPVFPQSKTINVVRPQVGQIRTTSPQIRPIVKTPISGVKTTILNKSLTTTSSTSKPTIIKEKKSFSSGGNYTGDDDINDVAAMGGVNLAEETQKILGSTEFVGTQIRSCKDEVFLLTAPLQHRIRQAAAKHGLEEPSNEVAALVSHATQEYLKNMVEKLAVITEHRIELLKNDTSRYEVTQDIKGQLKFLEELDRAERKRHDEQEREILLRAAKSRSKNEDPEQAKLKAKAKEMQRVELEELRQREANATALQAIGPRKKQRLDGDQVGTTNQVFGIGGNTANRTQLPLRQRIKKVTLRDILFLMESEKQLCRTPVLYRSYLK